MFRTAAVLLYFSALSAHADFYSTISYSCRDLSGLVSVEYNEAEGRDATLRYGFFTSKLRIGTIIADTNSGSENKMPRAYTQDRSTGMFVELLFLPAAIGEGTVQLFGIMSSPSYFGLPNMMGFGPFQTPPPMFSPLIPLRKGGIIMAYLNCTAEFKNHDRKRDCALDLRAQQDLINDF